VPDEDRMMDALRAFALSPGDYIIPYVGHPSNLKSEAMQQKVAKGPIGALTVYPPNVMFNMGSQLAQCGLPGRACAPSDGGLSLGVSDYGRGGVRVLLDGTHAALDLVFAELADDPAAHVRRPRLRVVDRGHVRVAVAVKS
jgi:hypothetical protein